MKQIRIIGSTLTIVALLFCLWSIYQLSQKGAEIVGESLSLLYFASLFISVVCFRISLGYSGKIKLLTTALSIVIIGSSTYTWLHPSELLIAGKITLGLIPLLVGTTLGLIVNGGSKLSKLLWLTISTIAILLSAFVFIGVHSSSLYLIAFFGMILTTLSVVVHFIFAK